MNLKEQLRKALQDARAICEGAEKEGRDFTAEERTQVQTLLEQAKGFKEQLKAAEGDVALRKALADLGVGLDSGDKRAAAGVPGDTAKGTIGEQFVGNPAFQAWLKAMAPGGQFPEGVRGFNSPPIEFKALLAMRGRKDVVTGASATSAGAFIVPDFTNIYEALGRRELVLRDLIDVRTTQSDTVEFVRQVHQVTQAAPVAESNVTTPTGATGEVTGEKPEAALEFERVQAVVKTIAAWIPATKRALSDASQLRGIIDQELQEDLADEFEDQLINGNGIGENLTGLLNTANVLIQPWDTDIFRTTRKARTYLVRTGRVRPTAWLLNPTDSEAIDLTQDAIQRYYYGGPMVAGPRTLWGYPIVESEVVPEHTGILGAWNKMVVWDRERSTISVSDSHADFFIRNMLAILAEMRAAMGVIRPSGFVTVDLSAGS